MFSKEFCPLFQYIFFIEYLRTTASEVLNLNTYLILRKQRNKVIDCGQLRYRLNKKRSKCDQIHRKLQIWLHLLRKSLMENFIFCADTHKHPLPLLNKVCNGIQEVPVYHRYSHFLVKKWLRLCCLNYRFVFILCALRSSVLYDLLKFQDRWWILSKVILCDILYKVDPNLDPDLPKKRAL